MAVNLSLALKYGKYKLSSQTKHDIHSPFVFNLLTTVIEDNNSYYVFDKLAAIRKELESSEEVLEIEDLGAGSKHFTSNKRKVNGITKHGISTDKYARLLFRLVNHFHPRTVIELGTSVGLTTMYLASADSKQKIHTIEGSKELADFAQKLFRKHGYGNIELITGNFDVKLPELIQNLDQLDLIYIDGNHTKKATLGYFEMALQKKHNDSVFIFDDIHWSEEMESAWEEIKKHKDVTLSLDLFHLGIVFFRKEQKEKEHFVLRF